MYWTTKTGEKILIDNMTESHAKNSLKLLLNQYNQLVNKSNDLIEKYEALKKKNQSFSTSETTDLFNSSFSYVLTIDEEEFDDYEIDEEDYDI